MLVDDRISIPPKPSSLKRRFERMPDNTLRMMLEHYRESLRDCMAEIGRRDKAARDAQPQLPFIAPAPVLLQREAV